MVRKVFEPLKFYCIFHKAEICFQSNLDAYESESTVLLKGSILSPAQVPAFGSKHHSVPVNLHLIIDFLQFRLCLSWGK